MDALILAGGENKRLPVIKGFLDVDGKRIIESNVELLEKIFDRVIISTNNPELYFYLGVVMVGDIVEDRGPMTGILSALTMPDVSEVFVTACDMPFIKPALVKYIVDSWDRGPDAVIPVFEKKPQPLLGIYSKKLAYHMERSIKNKQRSLTRFLEKVNVRYIDEQQVRRIDPEGRSFVNINTMEDYQTEIGGKPCLV